MTRIMLPVGNHEACISQAIEGIGLARRLDEPVMEADFMMLIGMSYYDMGDKPHAWKKMNEGMEKVKAISVKTLKDADRTKLATMALTAATAHANDQRTEETIASCHTTIAILDTLHSGNADMLRSQAYAMMAGAFANLAGCGCGGQRQGRPLCPALLADAVWTAEQGAAAKDILQVQWEIRRGTAGNRGQSGTLPPTGGHYQPPIHQSAARGRRL